MAGNASVGLRIFLDDALSSGLQLVNVNMGQFGFGLMSLIQSAGAANSALSDLLPIFGEIGGSALSFDLFSNGMKSAVTQAGNLQISLTQVQIALNATDEQMRSVGASITTIADNSTFSTQEVAQAFQMLAERGWNAQQIVGSVGQASIDLAEAINSQTTPAADLLGKTMQVFGAKANEAQYYASALTFAFYNGIPSVQELTTSLSQTSEIAAQTHTPISELVVTLDYLNQKGITASTAASSLRYMMQALIDPTAKAQKEMEDLGLITANQATPAFNNFISALDASGKAGATAASKWDGSISSLNALFTAGQKAGTIPLDKTFLDWASSVGMLNDKLYNNKGQLNDWFTNLQTIGNSLKGKTQEDFNTALGNLFNVRSGQGGGVLLQNIDQVMQHLEQLKSKFNAFAGSGGAASDASKVTDDFNNAVKKLQTTLGSFMALVGTPLLTPLTNLVGTINNLVSVTSSGGTSVSGFGASFLTIGTILSVVGLLVGGVAGTIALAGTTIGAALLPVAGIALGAAAGITGLSLAGAWLVTNWNTVAPILQTVANVVITLGGAFLGAWGSILLYKGVQAIFAWGPELPGILAQAGTAVVQMGAKFLTAVGDLIVYGATQLSMVVATAWAGRAALLAEAAAWILANAPIVIAVGLFIAAGLGLYLLIQHFGGLNSLLKLGASIWNSLLPILQSIGNQIKSAFLDAIKQLQPVWSQLMGAFNQAKPMLMMLGVALGAIAAIILGVLAGAFRGLLGVVVPIITMIINVVTGFIKVVMGIAQVFMSVFTIIHGILTGNFGEITAGFKSLGQGILTIFSGLWQMVSSIFIGAFNAIKGLITGFISGFIGFFQHLFDVMVGHSIIPDLVNSIVNWIMQLPGRAMSMISQFVNAIISGASQLAGKFHDNVIQPIINKVQGLIGQMASFGASIINNLAQGIIGNIASALGNAMNAVGNFVSSHLPHSPAKEGPLKELHNQGAEIPNQIALGIHSNVGALGSAAQRMGNALLPQNFLHPNGLAFSPGGVYGGAGSGATSNINLVVDGKTMASVVLDHTTNTLKMNGMGRSLK